MTRPLSAPAIDHRFSLGADDLAAAFNCFRLTAAAVVANTLALRPARPADAALRSACVAALTLPQHLSHDAARAFFTGHFEPRPLPGPAFFTGYYEPIVDGALDPSADFAAPLLGRPADLKTFAADEPRPAWAASLSAARLGPDGALSPFPDRAAIEADALSGAFRPVVWLRDWVEAYLIHIQGSARVRLPDGRTLRLTYAGRNGHPYTSIGKILIGDGEIDEAEMSLAVLKDWLRRNGQQPGQRGRDLLQRNASFIFFDAEMSGSDAGSTGPASGTGPTGGAGVPLTAGRSIAVDRALWCYGLPFWIDAVLPWEGGPPSPVRRLMIAQDTGSAIVGTARADLFFGSGDTAGLIAGGIRQTGAMTVLWPMRSGPVR